MDAKQFQSLQVAFRVIKQALSFESPASPGGKDGKNRKNSRRNQVHEWNCAAFNLLNRKLRVLKFDQGRQGADWSSQRY